MNGHGSGGRPAVFEVTSESALAWYFVLANWPGRPQDRPLLRFEAGCGRVLVHEDDVRWVAKACESARHSDRALARSAETLIATLDRRQTAATACALY